MSSIQIIEQFIEGKGKNIDECEDGIFVNDNFVAVVDGATAKSPRTWGGKKSGRVACDLILSAFPLLAADNTGVEVMTRVDQSIHAWYERNGDLEHMRVTPADRPSASAVVYSTTRREIWFVGDCQARIDLQHVTNEKVIDVVTTDARVAFLEAEILSGKSIEELRLKDTGKQFIDPLLERQNHFQNNESAQFGYPVLDGFFTGWGCRVVPIGDAKEIVLASDGYPFLFGTLAETEASLREVLSEDPLLYKKFRSTKGWMTGTNSFDDRAYIRFKV